ncbi:hypothetical protein PybrP1_004811 [[Pythium] brassicae (nom. inval.)]|nr:hypothetical protein PybrP1_004811 [[Pythium] brassicae (nom. inval.)]
MTTAKALSMVWDEVQGACDLPRLQQALSGAGRPFELMLDGWSPLHFVCENRSLANATRARAIAVLVRAGVDCCAVDEHGWSALHVLCKNRSRADEWGSDLSTCVRELVAAKTPVNLQTTDSKKTALHLLCENDACSSGAIEALLSAGANASAVDEDGNTPLHYASESSEANAAVLGLLLSAKANANVQNQNSAVTTDAIRVMLKHGADPNTANNIGNSPLHYLCENYATSVAMLSEVIDSKKANLTITNSLGRTAFACIPSSKHECISYLQKFAVPTLVQPKGNQSVEAGGEDASELPEPLRTALVAWNASLPPCDMSFYQAVCCEPAFAASYEAVQEVSVALSESPTDAQLFASWESSLKTWRDSILLAFAALIPPHTWEQFAAKYNRAVPADLRKVSAKVAEVWQQFPDQVQRRDRFEYLAGVWK